MSKITIMLDNTSALREKRHVDKQQDKRHTTSMPFPFNVPWTGITWKYGFIKKYCYCMYFFTNYINKAVVVNIQLNIPKSLSLNPAIDINTILFCFFVVFFCYHLPRKYRNFAPNDFHNLKNLKWGLITIIISNKPNNK